MNLKLSLWQRVIAKKIQGVCFVLATFSLLYKNKVKCKLLKLINQIRLANTSGCNFDVSTFTCSKQYYGMANALKTIERYKLSERVKELNVLIPKKGKV